VAVVSGNKQGIPHEPSHFRQVFGNHVRPVELENHVRLVDNMRSVSVQRLTFEKRIDPALLPDLLFDRPDVRAAARALLATQVGNGSRCRDLEKISAIREQVDLDDASPRLSASLESLKVETRLSSLYKEQSEAAVSAYPGVGKGSATCASSGTRMSL
jgi:hypothetical protein